MTAEVLIVFLLMLIVGFLLGYFVLFPWLDSRR